MFPLSKFQHKISVVNRTGEAEPTRVASLSTTAAVTSKQPSRQTHGSRSTSRTEGPTPISNHPARSRAAPLRWDAFRADNGVTSDANDSYGSPRSTGPYSPSSSPKQHRFASLSRPGSEHSNNNSRSRGGTAREDERQLCKTHRLKVEGDSNHVSNDSSSGYARACTSALHHHWLAAIHIRVIFRHTQSASQLTCATRSHNEHTKGPPQVLIPHQQHKPLTDRAGFFEGFKTHTACFAIEIYSGHISQHFALSMSLFVLLRKRRIQCVQTLHKFLSEHTKTRQGTRDLPHLYHTATRRYSPARAQKPDEKGTVLPLRKKKQATELTSVADAKGNVGEIHLAHLPFPTSNRSDAPESEPCELRPYRLRGKGRKSKQV